ncbi:hypothetical protein D3C73_947330 [compost metagenome]
MITEVRRRRRDDGTVSPINGRVPHVRIHVFTQQEGVAHPHILGSQTASGIQHRAGGSGGHGIVDETPKLALDGTVLAPDGLHLIDAQVVFVQELARQLDVIGRAGLARRPGEGQGVVHETVSGVVGGLARRLAREVDLGDPRLFQGAKLAFGGAAVLVAIDPDLQLSPALIEGVQLAVAVRVPSLKTFEVGLRPFPVLDE